MVYCNDSASSMAEERRSSRSSSSSSSSRRAQHSLFSSSSIMMRRSSSSRYSTFSSESEWLASKAQPTSLRRGKSASSAVGSTRVGSSAWWAAFLLGLVVVFCCGPNDGSLFGAEAVSTGQFHSCTVFEDGTVKCWGLNGSGQLGLGDNSSRGASPTHMGDDLPEVDLGVGFFAVAVSAGYDHSCAVTLGGRMKCWGDNAWGQLGYGDTDNRGETAASMRNLTYVDVGSGSSVVDVVAGRYYTCVHLADETIKCFGRNDEGQLGSQNPTDNRGDGPDEMGDELPTVRLAATGANLTIHALSANSNPCVIFSSTASVGTALKCWGPNGYGQLGMGDTFHRGDDTGEMGEDLLPISLGAEEVAVSLAAGHDFHCALLESGTVKCWGRNTNGQCGGSDVETYGDDPDEMGDNLPFVDLGSTRTAVALTAGDAHACALLDDDSVKCWGKGYYGATGMENWRSVGVTQTQMGDSLPAIDLGTTVAASTSTSSSRRQLRGMSKYVRTRRGLQATETYLNAGGDRSCAILAGVVKCWGRGFEGGLGLGDTTDRGDQSGSMGDALPALELGAGKVAVAPSQALVSTPAPTQAPSMAPTPVPTMAPTTLAPSLAPVTIQPTLVPTTVPTPVPSPAPTTPGPSPAPTPVPTVAPTPDAGSTGFRAFTEDVGVTETQGYVLFGGVPLALLALCCCFGFCCAKRKKANNVQTKDTARDRSPGSGSAAPIAPASRSHSAASMFGGASSSTNVFCATNGPAGKKKQDLVLSHGSGLFADPKFNNGDAPLYADAQGFGHVSHRSNGSGQILTGTCVEAGLTTPDKGDDDTGSTLGPIVRRGFSSSDTPPQHSWGPAQTINGCASGTPEAWGRKKAPRSRDGGKSRAGAGVEESKGSQLDESKAEIEGSDDSNLAAPTN